jgi:large subunit ribosomal protein L20
MPRVKRSTKRNDRRKKILDRASGYFLTKSKLYQAAQEAVERGLKFAYTGRKQKKRQFRSLWIVRISAAAKLNNASYSQFINGLKRPASSWIARFWPTSLSRTRQALPAWWLRPRRR